MRNSRISESEMILNADDSIFHLHLTYNTLADNVILVGDPSRVELFSKQLEQIEASDSNREFVWVTGRYKSTRVTILSTGIGSDNIDIVLNELDAAANIDFTSRTEREHHRTLNIVRIGTCGAIQDDIESGEVLISELSIGTDPLLHFYSHNPSLFREDISEGFMEHMKWSRHLSRPYVVECSKELLSHFEGMARRGITVTAPGFYAPQGRTLRLKPQCDDFISRLQSFKSSNSDLQIVNLEMESAPVAMLARLLGHRAITLCVAIAQRSKHNSNTDYKKRIVELSKTTLEIFNNL